MRLDRLLANLGYGSRRDVKGLVHSGRVRVADDVVRSEATQIRDAALVTVDGEVLDHPSGLLIALNKPLGYVCSHDDGEGKRAYDLLPPRWLDRNPRVESIGRLDRDTSGLILLTDDHQLVHRLTSPKHHVEKRYIATLAQSPDDDVAARFASGELLLDGESTPCRPVVAFELLSDSDVALTIVEGRYHQVRRMFAAVGCHVESLHRTDVGPISLGDLAEGAHRVLAASEVELLTAR